MERFIKICRFGQKNLKKYVTKALRKYGYENVISADGFVYAKGSMPILLTAHMDTVHKQTPSNIIIEKQENETIVSSPQGIGGDDRCGIYMILNILSETKFRPTILFCEDEEIGSIGAGKFVKHTDIIDEMSDIKYLIELDRANANDAVFYDCDNPEFTEYITDITGYKEAHGSWSDICTLSPVIGAASVNLSCGYYKAHTKEEFVVFEEMKETIKAVKKLLADTESVKYEFIEKEYLYGDWYGNKGYSYYDSYYPTYKTYSSANTNRQTVLEVWYGDKCDSVTGKSEEDCWWRFFIGHPNVCFNDVQDWDTFEI